MESSLAVRPPSYRADSVGDADRAEAVAADLDAAREALQLALLVLEGDGEAERTLSRRLAQTTQARACIGEALTALGRARVFVPGVCTHPIAAVVAGGGDLEGERRRLHHLASRLLWSNHALLPTRPLAPPLRPEDEAQLARVVDGLARHAQVDRSLRFAWLPLLLSMIALGPIYGVPTFGLWIAAATAALGAWQLRDERVARARA